MLRRACVWSLVVIVRHCLIFIRPGVDAVFSEAIVSVPGHNRKTNDDVVFAAYHLITVITHVNREHPASSYCPSSYWNHTTTPSKLRHLVMHAAYRKSAAYEFSASDESMDEDEDERTRRMLSPNAVDRRSIQPTAPHSTIRERVPPILLFVLICTASALLVVFVLLLLSPSSFQTHRLSAGAVTSAAVLLSSSSANLCRVQDSLGMWQLDAYPHEWRSLPGECRIYPFVDALAGVNVSWVTADTSAHSSRHIDWLPEPQPLHTSSNTTLNNTIASSDGTVLPSSSPHLAFLRIRYILWLADSVDRFSMAWLCGVNSSNTNVADAAVIAPTPYRPAHPSLNQSLHIAQYVNFTKHVQGAMMCYMPGLNLTLAHGQSFGMAWQGEFDVANMIENTIPAHFIEAAQAVGIGEQFSRREGVANGTQGQADVVVVHSCAWDAVVTLASIEHVSDDTTALRGWMKRFETAMLIPALTRYDPTYRAWQHRYLSAQVDRMLSDNYPLSNKSAAALVIARKRLYEQLRLATFAPNSTTSDSTHNPLTHDDILLAPSPASHPVPIHPPLDSAHQRPTPSSIPPLIVMRTCTPGRDELHNQPQYRGNCARINRAYRMLARHYDLPLIDTWSMVDGLQDREDTMSDHLHWWPNQGFQFVNLVLNFYRQHLIKHGQ